MGETNQVEQDKIVIPTHMLSNLVPFKLQFTILGKQRFFPHTKKKKKKNNNNNNNNKQFCT